MRYFIRLSYLGSRFHGWQRQPNAITVQEKIETAFSTILKKDITILGCGRTDTGVHAREFFAHVDLDLDPSDLNSSDLDSSNLDSSNLNSSHPNSSNLDKKIDLAATIRSVDALSGPDIAIYDIYPVDDNLHARFDAKSRTYEYLLSTQHDPFTQGTSYAHRSAYKLDLAKLQQAADLLLKYQDFFPFTKTHSDTPHYKCALSLTKWEQLSPTEYKFTIRSNRFLRGMVRLIVGMCIQVAEGKIKLDKVRSAMDNQQPLERAWSVPACGLYLIGVEY